MRVRRALICAPVMPDPDRESGSRRIFDWIEFLREDGWAVSFAARQAPDGERCARLLRQRGVAAYVGFDGRTEELLSAVHFDLAILAFWHVAESLLPAVRQLLPETCIVVDSIDLHFLRNARRVFQRASDNDAVGALDQGYASEMIRELNAYVAADGVLTVSEKEADLIRNLTGAGARTFAVPDAEDPAPSPVPFSRRRGIVFVGNFLHTPNVSAVEYLCREVLPRLDPKLRAEHPLYLVGNALNDSVRGYAEGLPHVEVVGWVPAVLPYLQQARISVVPLLYGAGTKRKLIQSLMAGTPAVSTTIGIEGLDLCDREHVLVADDGASFAEAVGGLLQDAPLWERLAAAGGARLQSVHGREAVRKRFLEALACVLAQPRRPAPAGWCAPSLPPGRTSYPQLVQRIRQVVRTAVPAGARVIVVSKGDEELCQLDGREAWHFPQTDAGLYAGNYPADSTGAIAHLEALRSRGGEFLLFPSTALWWLDHYADLHRHLKDRYELIHSDESCRIYRLTGKAQASSRSDSGSAVPPHLLEKLRPVAPDVPWQHYFGSHAQGKKVLVLGIYLAAQQTAVDDVVAIFSRAKSHRVVQRWVALAGPPPSSRVADVTVRALTGKSPKFAIVNNLLSDEDRKQYDYVMVVDDDIVLPEDFADRFVSLQASLGFAIAQPARTSNSYIDHPIVEQQLGVLARQTLFVEVGPVVSFHRSCYELVFPFDLTSPMGWGYESVWSYRLAKRGLKMGIIDVLPVDHSLRKPVANYDHAEADRQRKALLRQQQHYPLDQCFRVVNVISRDFSNNGGGNGVPIDQRPHTDVQPCSAPGSGAGEPGRAESRA